MRPHLEMNCQHVSRRCFLPEVIFNAWSCPGAQQHCELVFDSRSSSNIKLMSTGPSLETPRLTTLVQESPNAILNLEMVQAPILLWGTILIICWLSGTTLLGNIQHGDFILIE